MTTLEIVSYVLILVSAVFKGIALMNLNNKNREFAISKKLYTKFDFGTWCYFVCILQLSIISNLFLCNSLAQSARNIPDGFLYLLLSYRKAG